MKHIADSIRFFSRFNVGLYEKVVEAKKRHKPTKPRTLSVKTIHYAK